MISCFSKIKTWASCKSDKVLLILLILCFFIFNASAQESVLVDSLDKELVSEFEKNLAPESVSFGEVWAYLMAGEERFLTELVNISDVCYFSATINIYGELNNVPKVTKLSKFNGRKHLVLAELSDYTLLHNILDPSFGIRDKLIDDIINATEPYDGLQIDFEAIPIRDRENFIEFLSLLDSKLGNKVLSVALPARLSKSGDVLGYNRISKIVDRIILMAYDEHYSTSEPGPVATISWCGRIADYALQEIPQEKIVMGLPFYGRAWGDVRTNSAYRYSSINKLIIDKNVEKIEEKDGIPWFLYEEKVKVKVFYDDEDSTTRRMAMYANKGVTKIAFWRIGQEDTNVWNRIKIK